MNLNKILPTQDKRGDFSVVIFVMLTLLLCGYSLYALIVYQSNIKENLSGFDVSEKFILKEKEINYYLFKATEQCTIESYATMINEQDYFSESISEIKGLKVLSGEENTKSDLEFSKLIESCLKKYGESYSNLMSDSEVNLEETEIFISKLKEGVTKVELIDGTITSLIKNFQLTSSDEKSKYQFDIKSEFSLKSIGLIELKDIALLSKCEGDKTCIEQTSKKLFEVEVTELEENSKSYYRIGLESKRTFKIEEEFKKISIVFLVEKKD